MRDAILTAPVIADGRAYVADASGTVTAIDTQSLRVLWEFADHGHRESVNNVSSPVVAGDFLHFGTTGGVYYVLEAKSGRPVKEILCGEPIFASPVFANGRVYFATLGSQVYALSPDGTVAWTWDYVQEQLGFLGNRWSGEAWVKHKGGKLSDKEQFMCARDLAVEGKTIVVPAGGSLVWLEDVGAKAECRAAYWKSSPEGTSISEYYPRAATLGLSIGEDGTVYRQWHWLDNEGHVDRLRLRDSKVEALKPVPGTDSSAGGSALLSFSSVAIRGDEIFRSRPQEGHGLCRHLPSRQQPDRLDASPSITPPILLRDHIISCGLDGTLSVVPMDGGKAWSFKTAFGKAISAPAAVANGRIYFGCEDGYLYILGPDRKAPLPDQDLELWKLRHRLSGERAGEEFDRFTPYGNFSNTNAGSQGLRPPFRIKWIRRFEGTVKHLSTFGGGRMYTHTAEGQIFAVEEETGRLLWRQYTPGVHLSYTAPLYCRERLLVPQAGFEKSRLRCLDAATGKLVWEAPFAGSPSWNRQLPPVVFKELAIYMFGTGRYGPGAPEDSADERRMEWLFGHQNVLGFPNSHKPMVRAYDLATGRTVWESDFSEFGSGGDEAGLCLMDGTLYYSCYFGRSPMRDGRPGPHGITAAIDPGTGRILWSTTAYSTHGGCTISGKDGRLYLGGYNPEAGTNERHVWCLDAKDGSLIWRSEPLLEAIQVPTVGSRFIFIHAQYKQGYLLDKETGKIISSLAKNYKCTRFTMSEPYLLGSNLDLLDISNPADVHLVSTGPRVDPSECVGSTLSNGRIYYTGHGSGLQVCEVYGLEAESEAPPWAQTDR